MSNAVYQTQHVTKKLNLNITENMHITFKITHIVDGFGHDAYIIGCYMNEYRRIS